MGFATQRRVKPNREATPALGRGQAAGETCSFAHRGAAFLCIVPCRETPVWSGHDERIVRESNVLRVKLLRRHAWLAVLRQTEVDDPAGRGNRINPSIKLAVGISLVLVH